MNEQTLFDKYEYFRRMHGRACERQAKAWKNLDDAIEAKAPVRELDRLERIAVRWSIVQSSLWHKRESAKEEIVTAYKANEEESDELSKM